MSRRLTRGWTIGTLAAHVGVSRATLARRFATNVGDSPAGYLTRWRMDLAARRLRDTDDPISVIAASVGYTSEYAFSRAFTRARARQESFGAVLGVGRSAELAGIAHRGRG